MRLWSIHPKYLDGPGLVALWREALLAQKVLKGGTTGYRHHPQLVRFKSHPAQIGAIATYLQAVFEEAVRRGYAFDAGRISRQRVSSSIPCTSGQLVFEWEHLRRKLRVRCPERFREMPRIAMPDPHPLFMVIPGKTEPWEKGTLNSGG